MFKTIEVVYEPRIIVSLFSIEHLLCRKRADVDISINFL